MIDAKKEATVNTKGGSKLTLIAKDQINPDGNIMYTDIKDDFLFVGYAFHGIDVFNINDPKKVVKIGRFGKDFWADEKNEDKTWGKHGDTERETVISEQMFLHITNKTRKQ